MSRIALVLRPQPGADETARRLAAAGVTARCEPLFAVAPLAWEPPDPTRYDALLLTSANAVRHGGVGLAALQALPVGAVGPATATAARSVGFTVALTGDGDAAALVAAAHAGGWARLLHLAGRHHRAIGVDVCPVYASEPVPVDADTVADWQGHVALLHSPRAARRLAALVGERRSGIAIAALSPAIAAAAGSGWGEAVVADAPRDARLVAAACALIDRWGRGADKCG